MNRTIDADNTSEFAAHAAAAPLIELVDASVASPLAPSTPKIEEINWCIASGDYWVVAGLPVSGKTELLATAAGLLRPLRGIHRLFGRELSGLEGEELLRERLRVGMIYGGGARLFQHLSVAQNVALPFCYHHNCTTMEAQGAVSELLDLMELGAVAHALAGRIGWHLRQRVGLARALILKPEVLLLDDPTAGLEPRQAQTFLDILDRLVAGQDGWSQRLVTLAISTGNLRMWRERARQFALIKEGRWLTLGGRAELAATHESLALELLGEAFSAS